MKLNYKWEALRQHPEDESYYWTDLYTQFGVFKIATNRTEAPGEFAVYSNGNLRPKKIVETIEEGKEWVNKQLIEKTELVLGTIVQDNDAEWNKGLTGVLDTAMPPNENGWMVSKEEEQRMQNYRIKLRDEYVKKLWFNPIEKGNPLGGSITTCRICGEPLKEDVDEINRHYDKHHSNHLE